MALPFQPQYDKWEPPDDLLNLLATQGLRTRDKVEIVYAFYAKTHNGQGPYASEISIVLGISKHNVEMRMQELINEGRAIRINGKFTLQRAQYTHAAIRELVET